MVEQERKRATIHSQVTTLRKKDDAELSEETAYRSFLYSFCCAQSQPTDRPVRNTFNPLMMIN